MPPFAKHARAEMTGPGTLTITMPGGPLPGDYQWSLDPPAHVTEQVRRHRYLAVSVTTKVLPSLIGPDQLLPAFTDPEVLTGLIPVTVSAGQDGILSRIFQRLSAGA